MKEGLKRVGVVKLNSGWLQFFIKEGRGEGNPLVKRGEGVKKEVDSDDGRELIESLKEKSPPLERGKAPAVNY